MKRLSKSLLALSMALSPLATQAQVFGADAAYTGTRSIGSGLVAGTPGYTSLTIDWEITPFSAGVLQYQYTFTGLSPVNGISHLILSLSPNCSSTAGCVYSAVEEQGGASGAPELSFGTFGPHPSNPGFPAGTEIYGVKLNTPGDVNGESGLVLTFLSNRAPVWGDIYVKGARDLYSYNVGLTDHGSMNVTDFVARPDTYGPTTPVPEPATIGLLGFGLAALGGVAARRRRA